MMSLAYNNVMVLLALCNLCMHGVSGRGLLLLYRPKDASNECAFSSHLRYDLSFGMGMSDTITLVFRNIKEIDYECYVDIVTDAEQLSLIIVVRFPNLVEANCAHNANAFIVLKQNRWIRICDLIGKNETTSPYFIAAVKGRIRFRFISNSSVNADMDANVYQVTATSAREKPKLGCNMRNESLCSIKNDHYCYTSGVVCDGIKNCGVSDWFDERKSECYTPLERIGYIPVVAVAAATLCVVLAAAHILIRCLPPLANSFFIFNTNEDNRLRVDPVFDAPEPTTDTEAPKKVSLIPVSSSTSKETIEGEHPDNSKTFDIKRINDIEFENISQYTEELEVTSEINNTVMKSQVTRKTTIKNLTDMLQRHFGSINNRRSKKDQPTTILED